MRKIILGLGVSLDGYIARPDGAVDFLFMPKDYSMVPFFATVDVNSRARLPSESTMSWHFPGAEFPTIGSSSAGHRREWLRA
jgi:hypothetical protein